MHPRATISHRTANRLRLHIPHYKRNTAYFARLRDELSHCEGVEYVRANPQTATVLIHHRSTPEQIARFAEEMKLFVLAIEDAPMDATSVAARINKRISTIDAKLTALTRGSLDLPSVSAIGLVAVGLFQSVVRRNMLPSGANMFWWAASILAREHQKGTLAAVRRRVSRQPPKRTTRPSRG